jgi:hypothetical protein
MTAGVISLVGPAATISKLPFSPTWGTQLSAPRGAYTRPHWSLVCLRMAQEAIGEEGNDTKTRETEMQKRKIQLMDPMTPPPHADSLPAYAQRDYFGYELVYQSKISGARVGKIHTPHGVVDTPGFVPVATIAAQKGVTIARWIKWPTSEKYMDTSLQAQCTAVHRERMVTVSFHPARPAPAWAGRTNRHYSIGQIFGVPGARLECIHTCLYTQQPYTPQEHCSAQHPNSETHRAPGLAHPDPAEPAITAWRPDRVPPPRSPCWQDT